MVGIGVVTGGILFVSSVSELEGGAERSLLELAGALRGRGAPVSLAVWRAGVLSRAFEELGPAYVLGTVADPGSPLGGATTRYPLLRPLVRVANAARLWFRPVGGEARWLASVVEETGAAVVHTNCDLSPVAAARAGVSAGVPWIAHVRDDWRSWLHPRTARALRSADVVVAPSRYLADRFRDRRIDATVIPNPVAGDELRRSISSDERAGLRAELGLGPGIGIGRGAANHVGATADSVAAPFAVAVVGRLDEQKGTLRVVEVARYLEEAGDRRVRFLVAGAGTVSFEARLRRAIDAAGVADRVRLLGHRNDVGQWLPAMDALAVPSTGEPFGRMIVEGMHAGLPVLAFESGAAPELLDHDRTGVLLPPHDIGALAAALRTLAVDPERARRLGGAARSAAGRYEPPRAAEKMERLYQRLVRE